MQEEVRRLRNRDKIIEAEKKLAEDREILDKLKSGEIQFFWREINVRRQVNISWEIVINEEDAIKLKMTID